LPFAFLEEEAAGSSLAFLEEGNGRGQVRGPVFYLFGKGQKARLDPAFIFLAAM